MEETPHSEHETESDENPLVSSEYFTEPRPAQPASPIENLFSALLDFNQPLSTMATTTPAPKEINLNKPETFDGNRDKFKKFMQDVELYMDVNHEIYRDDLTKIAFILSFMNAGAAATWKTQFIDEANQRPAPADPRNKLGTYATFKTDLVDAFSMFDSAGDALDELRSLRMKKDDSIDEHIARFKLLAAEAKVDSNSTLTIELFKETLTKPLENRLMKLETPLTNLDDWYKWAMKIDHQYQKINRANERTRGNMSTQSKDKNPRQRFFFPRKERDPNAMDIDRLSFDERTKLMKEGRCFKCKKTGHRANECPDDEKKKEEPKKMGGRDLHTHVRALFKGLSEEDKEEFMKGAEEAGF